MLDNHIYLRYSFYEFQQDFTNFQKPDKAKQLKNKIAEIKSNQIWQQTVGIWREKKDEMCFQKGRVYIQLLLNVLWQSICTSPGSREVGASLSSHESVQQPLGKGDVLKRNKLTPFKENLRKLQFL